MKISLALLMLFIIAVPTLNPLVEGKSLEVKNSKEYVQIEVVEYKETKPVHKKTVSIEKEKAEWLFEELSKTRTPAAQISILRSYRLISGETEKLKQDAIGYAKKLGLANSEGENVINRDKGLMILGYIAAIGNGTVFLAKGSIDGIPRLHLLLYWRLWDALFSAAGILGRVVYREGCISRGMVLGFFGYGTYIKNPPVNWKERTGGGDRFFCCSEI